MTFMSGARIAEAPQRRPPGGVHDYSNRWVFSRRRNVLSDRLLSRSADGRLFHTVGPWKVKLRWPIDVCALGRSTHPADADRSQRLPGI